MGCGVYMITNLIDKKCYIGSSVNLKNRKYKHFWMLNKNKHDNQYLQNSYNKYGAESFRFTILEECNIIEIVNLENYYIEKYQSNNPNYGYNLAIVNEFRRNKFNNDVKIKLSKYNLNKNGNFTRYSLKNIETNEEFVFDNLIDGANYLIENNYAKGSSRNVRIILSNCLRQKKVNNGKNNNGSIRKSCYKHKFKILN
jgi:group I intron endonuclease